MKKRKIAFVVAFLVFGVAAAGLIAVVYAKYTSTIQVSGGAKVAKWAFESDNQSSSVTCSLTSTVADGAVKAGSNGVDIIAPGTSGTCSIQLSNTNSDVKVKYTITADTSASSGIPTNLKLDSSSLNSFTKTGTIAVGGSDIVDIIWTWPYETSAVSVDDGDSDDTDDGKAAVTDADMTLTFNVVGIQVNPATGE